MLPKRSKYAKKCCILSLLFVMRLKLKSNYKGFTCWHMQDYTQRFLAKKGLIHSSDCNVRKLTHFLRYFEKGCISYAGQNIARKCVNLLRLQLQSWTRRFWYKISLWTWLIIQSAVFMNDNEQIFYDIIHVRSSKVHLNYAIWTLISWIKKFCHKFFKVSL